MTELMYTTEVFKLNIETIQRAALFTLSTTTFNNPNVIQIRLQLFVITHFCYYKVMHSSLSLKTQFVKKKKEEE